MDRTRAQAIIDDHIDNEPRLRVLIVDDEEILVEMTRFQLQDAGFRRIDVAMDGEAAWQKISGDQPPGEQKGLEKIGRSRRNGASFRPWRSESSRIIKKSEISERIFLTSRRVVITSARVALTTSEC